MGGISGVVEVKEKGRNLGVIWSFDDARRVRAELLHVGLCARRG